jgi:hypothetical protein
MAPTDTAQQPASSDDSALWHWGTALLEQEFRALPEGRRSDLESLLARMIRLKEELCRLSDAVDGGTVCAECGGDCCRAGRYHACALDLLSSLAVGRQTATPDFRPGACPFLESSGCRIAPGERPFTCVIFVCDLIERRLTEERSARLHSLEQELRTLREQAGERFGRCLTEGFLFAADRARRTGCGFLRKTA